MDLRIIEEEHKEFLNLIELLHKKLVNFDPPAEIYEVMELIEHHAIKHFKDEEIYLEQIKYPHIAEHKSEHEYLVGILKRHMERIRTNFNEYDALLIKIVHITHMHVDDLKWMKYARKINGG